MGAPVAFLVRQTVMLSELLDQTPGRVAVLLDSLPLRRIESRQPVCRESLPKHREEQFLGLSLQHGIACRNQRVKARDEGDIPLPFLLCKVGVALFVPFFCREELTGVRSFLVGTGAPMMRRNSHACSVGSEVRSRPIGLGLSMISFSCRTSYPFFSLVCGLRFSSTQGHLKGTTVFYAMLKY